MEDAGISVSWYGFGSYFSDSPNFNDIDIMIMATDVEDCLKALKIANAVLEAWPIDLLALTVNEEKEVEFLKVQKIVPL